MSNYSSETRPARDLSWSIQSPPLVAGLDDESRVIYPDTDWFAEQSVRSDVLPDAPPERFRLGIHFEKIFQHWLEHHKHHELVAANLQVQLREANKQSRTLGEFDLLVQLDGKIEHWELAVKFYINVSSPDRADRWFGPDPKDTLGSKMSRMQTHQLALGEHTAAKAKLEEMGIKLDGVRSIVKGRLYHPFQTQDLEHAPLSGDTLPPIANPNHLTGWWLPMNQIHLLTEALESGRLAYIDKQYWLSTITNDDQVQPLNQSALDTFLKQTKQIAPQFAVIDCKGFEISRGFILKPEWFELANL